MMPLYGTRHQPYGDGDGYSNNHSGSNSLTGFKGETTTITVIMHVLL